MQKQQNKTEKEWFDTLYEYVRTTILGYDSNQSLSKNMVLKLKGLSQGKYMANNTTENKANYSYEVIYYTFVWCRQSILRAMQRKTFETEEGKFNYILAIIRNNINDMYLKVENKRQQEEEMSSILKEQEFSTDKPSGYTKKTKETHPLLNDLWD